MPAHAPETDILNELVVEYLDYHGFKNTLSVFSAEAALTCTSSSLSTRPNIRPRQEISGDLQLETRAFPPD
ncbi:hypothetical protein HK100_008039, partial [Physocladia obscura]